MLLLDALLPDGIFSLIGIGFVMMVGHMSWKWAGEMDEAERPKNRRTTMEDTERELWLRNYRYKEKK